MTRSANEVQTLVAKAARGGGAPAAQAAAFGRAAFHHMAAGCKDDELSAALASLPHGPILDLPLAMARLLENAQNGTAQGEVSCAEAPDLARSYAASLPFECAVTPTQTGAHLVIDTSRPAQRFTLVRITLEPEFVAILTALVAKTLVPESDASRLAGAGAGLTDND